MYAVPEHASLGTVTTTFGKGLIVTVTWSWAALHGPRGSSVVKTNVTLPELISQVLGVYVVESDEALKDTEALKKTLEHFEIISKDMVSIFLKNGITPVVSIGKKLDPNQHQAMMEIDDDQKEPGTIVQEIQKGFMMKDRLLRPALVGVSKKTKTPDDQKSEENKENSDN